MDLWFAAWGSCLRDGDLFHRLASDKIDMFESFNEAGWKNAVKLGPFKRDFSAEGFCAITEFVSWSFDSARLLIELRGGEDKRDMHEGYIYFNTRTKKFEVTDYLRKLNKTKANVLACAEPVDPLPSEAELKTRFDTLDRRLNTRYAEVLGKTDKERVANVREAQRNWIKHRDEGAKFYVSLFPAAEKELRRLQFLCDVTASFLLRGVIHKSPFDVPLQDRMILQRFPAGAYLRRQLPLLFAMRLRCELPENAQQADVVLPAE